MVWLLDGNWKICPWQECGDCEDDDWSQSQFWMVDWLERSKSDVVAMSALRELLEQVSNIGLTRFPGDLVLEQISHRIAMGELRLCRAVEASKPMLLARTLSQAASAPAFPLEERTSRSTSASATPEPASFPRDADLIAIAEAQKEAARLGIPFCEECAKARLARAS